MNDKLNSIMNNVMAALNTFGIEYDVNEVCGFSLCKDQKELLKSEQKVLNFQENSTFRESFKSFAERPQHSRISGKCWANDADSVIIQFSRSYIMTDKDWDDFAYMCGCSDPFEAQALYGDPNVSHIYFNVRVPKGKIHRFVSSYAHFCWTA